MAIDFYIGVCMYVYQYVILYILYIGLLGDVWGVGGGYASMRYTFHRLLRFFQSPFSYFPLQW